MLGPAFTLLIGTRRLALSGCYPVLSNCSALAVSASWTFRDEWEVVPGSRNSQMEGQKDKGGVHGQ